jgi:hypothetical protein
MRSSSDDREVSDAGQQTPGVEEADGLHVGASPGDRAQVGAPGEGRVREAQVVPPAAAEEAEVAEVARGLPVDLGLTVRCPDRGGPLLKLHAGWFEVACRSCRDTLRRDGRRVLLVLHRFSIDGWFLETYVDEVV